MAAQNAGILAFNRGRVSRKALARVDIDRMPFSADVQTNIIPRVLGSGSFRPGWEYLFASAGNAEAKYIPFIFSNDDTALLEVTASGVRIATADAIVTRPSVSTTITNGSFTSDITGWTDADEGTAASAWLTGGYLELVGTLISAAIRRQEVTVSGGDISTEHGVTFEIARGPVTVKIGSTAGGSDYIQERTLGTGTYSFAFTPSGNFHIELSSLTQAKALVASVSIDGAGDLVLPSPWAAADLGLLRYDASADVIFVACDGYQQRRFDRYDVSEKSWGLSLYETDDGPFNVINTGRTTITPSALTGDITLTASRDLFTSSMVGALFRHTSVGQQVTASFTANDQETDAIRVIGVEDSRIFQITISGVTAGTGTVTLQRSIDEEDSWTDVQDYTTDQASVNYDDGLDNQITYYRLKTTAYTSGTFVSTLDYSSGGITGIARVTEYTSATVVNASVLKTFGGADASRDWSQGLWSPASGYPTAVAFYEGRLWWGGRGRIIGSVSDAYESFDDEVDGDSAPIIRTIAFGGVDVTNWLLPLQRLILGVAGREISARSTSFDEILTVTNFNMKAASSQGSAKVPAMIVDSRGIFLQAGGTRLFETTFDFNANDYKPVDLTDIVPEIGEPEIVRMAIQRQPDTRLHCVRSDGTVGMLVREPDNEVLAWLDIETTGYVEDVVILPGAIEDTVYYHVRRTIDGETVRYLEKWALESEAVGGTVNKMADSFATFTNDPAASSIPAGTFSHLVGEEIVVWADGLCLKDAAGEIATFTVAADGGVAALTNEGVAYSATTGMGGIPYRGRFKSTKLAYGSELGTALNQRKTGASVGLVLVDTHAQGIKYGPDFDNMDDMPMIEDGGPIDTDEVYEEYEKDMFEWPGGWEVDARVCIEMNAPRPATLAAIVIGTDLNDV